MRQASRIFNGIHSGATIVAERGYATQGTTAAPALKVQLRELYKRIHPDRFHGFPPARDTNERSFKLLQEYLAAARQSDQDKAALPYRFIFYLHQAGAQQPVAANSATEASEGTPDGLHKVSLTLPPPARRDFAQPDQLPPATQASISKLLSACGLQSDVVGSLQQEEGSQRLRLFVPAAAELCRKREADQMGPKHQLSMVRTALRLGRQVTVGLSSSIQQKPAAVQADLLSRLASSLDRTPQVDVSGLHLMVGEEGYGPDKEGRLWLDADANTSLWSQYLKQADLAQCAQRRKFMQRIRNLEASVAQQMGVSMLYTNSKLQVQPQYTHLLERLANEATTRGTLKEPGSSEVPVQVLCDRDAEGNSESRNTGESDYVAVPVSASANDIYDCIQRHGPAVASLLRQQQVKTQRLEDFRRSVERRLRIRRLSRDPSLQDERFISCCKRMLHNSDSLSLIMDGLSFRISHANQVSSDGTRIDIAWDFEV